jgi:uncharacterized protein
VTIYLIEREYEYVRKNIGNNIAKDFRPVTVIVKRIAKENKIKEFEEWLSGISLEVSRQNGSMGIDIRPTDKESKPEYVIIFRFDNCDNLTKWENSSIRNEWLHKGKELVQSDPDVQKLTGLEFWFTPYSKKNSHSMPLNSPRRYKMVLVTIPAIALLLFTLVPQIHLIGEFAISPIFNKICFCYCNYGTVNDFFIMSLLTKVLRPWLFNS